MSAELPEPRPVPSVHVDAHFANVPRIKEVRFDAERCADLFMHPEIGIAERDLPRIHVYIRPDYKLGYSREERAALRAADPEEYDTESASCVPLGYGDPIGPKGDVLMTIVYGTHYGPDKLLRHEAIHARKMLEYRGYLGRLRGLLHGEGLPILGKYLDRQEEAEADRAMKSTALRGLSKGVIEVIRTKKK